MKNQTPKEIERASAVQDVRGRMSAGYSLEAACAAAGVTKAWFQRWSERFDQVGMYGMADRPRTGRPPSCVPTAEDAAVLRRYYLQSNRNAKSGSMSLTARYCARTGKLSEPVAAAILKPRASKHLLPVMVKRDCRASAAEVARYRDPKSGQNDGLYTPGWLRMASDGSRRLFPNERWVGDDGSVNVGLVVPWLRGGDRCSDRFGVRLARFQLLALIDCATDFCVGWNYVMRNNDAYSASDVVNTLWKVAALRGGMPAEIVMEGGSWQAQRTRDYLAACGTRLVSAKGRPNQKLIEGYFNKLWSVLAYTLPPRGHIGRFRGEMKKETELWLKCRKGVEDPSEHFPRVEQFFNALDEAVTFCNTDTTGPTRDYGTWIPAEAYGAADGQFPAMPLQPLPQGIRRFALPVRERRVLRRGGMCFVRCMCPFGWAHEYAFAVRDGAMFDGAPVIISFDPDDIRSGASVELAENWHDLRAGRIFDEAAPCISAAPSLIRTRNFWHLDIADPRRQAAEIKKESRALVGSMVSAYDARGVVARHETRTLVTPDGSPALAEGFGLRGATPDLPADGGYDNNVDFAELERRAGVS